MDYSRDISEFLVNVGKAYVEDQAQKKIKASGKSAASLHVTDLGPDTGTLKGASYFFQQIHGRGPGNFEPKKFMYVIRRWMDSKGIEAKGISRNSLAYLIAKKINEKGTDIYLGKRPGINVDDKVNELKEKLVKAVRDKNAIRITTEMKKLKK